MIPVGAVVLFLLVEAAGLCFAIGWMLDHGSPTPIPWHGGRYIFRLVHREDRAAYRRIMRRTFAVQARDFGRAMNRLGRQIGKAVLPPLQALAEQLAKIGREP